MNYIVSSRGQPIGVTDLGFYIILPRHRSGWLHPNAHGEKVLPVVATVLPALRAYAHRISDDDRGVESVAQHPDKSTLFADLAAAMQHVSALELTLHREDGSLIPTESVGVKDMDQLLELARSGEFDSDFDEADADELFAESTDLEALDTTSALSFEEEELRAWTPADDEETAFPRYQVYVTLLDDHPLP